MEEDVVAIGISPTTPGRISEVPIGMILRETIKYMLAVNAAIESLYADAVTTKNVGDVTVADDRIFQKLKLIGYIMAVEDVVLEDAVHITPINLEE